MPAVHHFDDFGEGKIGIDATDGVDAVHASHRSDDGVEQKSLSLARRRGLHGAALAGLQIQ